MLRGLYGMLGLLLSCGVALAAEDAVTLASTAPGYSQGMVMGGADRLQLLEGASLTLLLRSGQVLRLRGPLDMTLDRAIGQAPSAGSAVALAEALRLRGIDASAIGGSRSAAFGQRRPQPQDVIVDVQRSGTYCISAVDTVWLAQLQADQPDIALRYRGNTRSLAWQNNTARIEWPADVLIEDGDRFEVIIGGRPRATLMFRTVSMGNPTDAAIIAEAVLLGCREQYEAALRHLARTVLPPDLWLSSDRGRNPSYRPGELIVLSVMADTDGWLYCVTRRSDGTVMPVFPANAIDGARWPGAVSAAVPGPRRSLAIKAGITGNERIRCWLADRDIGAELPHGLLGIERLPDRIAGNLDGIFNAIGASRIVDAQLEVRVE